MYGPRVRFGRLGDATPPLRRLSLEIVIRVRHSGSIDCHLLELEEIFARGGATNKKPSPHRMGGRLRCASDLVGNQYWQQYNAVAF